MYCLPFYPSLPLSWVFSKMLHALFMFYLRICFFHLHLIKLTVLRCMTPFSCTAFPENVAFKLKNILATNVMSSNYSLCWETTDDALVLLSGFHQTIRSDNAHHLKITFANQTGMTRVLEMLKKIIKYNYIEN